MGFFVKKTKPIPERGASNEKWWLLMKKRGVLKREDPVRGVLKREDPVNTKHLYNIYTMLSQRLRRWPNIVQMGEWIANFQKVNKPESRELGLYTKEGARTGEDG